MNFRLIFKGKIVAFKVGLNKLIINYGKDNWFSGRK